MKLKELEADLLRLTADEKRELLKWLIAELDSRHEADIDAAWLQEAQRRFEELENGTVTGIPADEAIAKARERLRDAH